MENTKPTYWQNAERTNGKMAMMYNRPTTEDLIEAMEVIAK